MVRKLIGDAVRAAVLKALREGQFSDGGLVVEVWEQTWLQLPNELAAGDFRQLVDEAVGQIAAAVEQLELK
jgi:hypothetical protein